METQPLKFYCPDMEEGGRIPVAYTGRGENISPELLVENLSPAAKTLAVTLEDLSHPIKNFTHWVIWNIPAATRIPGRIPPGKAVPALGNAQQGVGYGLHRYAGPKPPRGKIHIYRLTVYSLDTQLSLSARSTKRTLLKAAEGHILQKGSITGRFG